VGQVTPISCPHVYLPMKIKCFLIILVLLSGLILINYSERIPFHDGVGFDGIVYAMMTIDFYHSNKITYQNNYFVQRTLPSFLVGKFLRTTGIGISLDKIINGYAFLTLFNLFLSAILLSLMTKELKISPHGEILGFAGLFLNFAALKYFYYYPILTDSTAFLLSMAMAYAYIKKMRILLLILIILGAFTWPTLPLMGLILFAFPKTQLDQKQINLKLSSYVSLLITLCLAIAIFYTNIVIKYINPIGTVLYHPLMVLSILLMLGYLFLGIKILLNVVPFNRQIFLQHLKRAEFWIACLMMVSLFILFQSLNLNKSLLWSSNIKSLFSLGVKVPLVFFVAHIIYFGPLFALMIIFYKEYCKLISEWGAGMILITILVIIFSIDSDSRHLTGFIPIIFIFLIKAIDQYKINRWDLGIFILLCLLFSKVWFKINSLFLNKNIYEGILQYPLQNYFMHHGPYMNYQNYLIQGALVVLMLMIFYFKRKNAKLSYLGTHLVT